MDERENVPDVEKERRSVKVCLTQRAASNQRLSEFTVMRTHRYQKTNISI